MSVCRVSSMYKEYSDDQLYTQLSFIDFLLDSQRMMKVRTEDPGHVCQLILIFIRMKSYSESWSPTGVLGPRTNTWRSRRL